MNRRTEAYQLGLDAESRAERLLNAAGYRTLDRRARMRGGEIDLIVEDDDTLIFVEVKARSSLAKALEAVPNRQQARIRAGLRQWLAEHDREGTRLARQSIRCDVVAVAPDEDPLHIPNAFPAADESGS